MLGGFSPLHIVIASAELDCFQSAVYVVLTFLVQFEIKCCG